MDNSLHCPVVMRALLLRGEPVHGLQDTTSPFAYLGDPVLMLSPYPYATCALHLPWPRPRRAATLVEPFKCTRCCTALPTYPAHTLSHYPIQPSQSPSPLNTPEPLRTLGTSNKPGRMIRTNSWSSPAETLIQKVGVGPKNMPV